MNEPARAGRPRRLGAANNSLAREVLHGTSACSDETRWARTPLGRPAEDDLELANKRRLNPRGIGMRDVRTVAHLAEPRLTCGLPRDVQSTKDVAVYRDLLDTRFRLGGSAREKSPRHKPLFDRGK
jgi:hypothetical protein